MGQTNTSEAAIDRLMNPVYVKHTVNLGPTVGPARKPSLNRRVRKAVKVHDKQRSIRLANRRAAREAVIRVLCAAIQRECTKHQSSQTAQT